MKEELEDKLFEDFPALFRRTKNPTSEKVHFYGVECNDGWFDLLYELAEKISDVIEKKGLTDVYAVQVKEKYGGLRFYMSSATDEIFDLIDEYESKSLKTCEVCGKPGKIRNTSWVTVLCDDHNKRNA